jgi:hypothetical protein
LRFAQRRLDDERVRRAQRIDTDRQALLALRDDVDERLHADGCGQPRVGTADRGGWPPAAVEQQRGERDAIPQARSTGHRCWQRHRDDGGHSRPVITSGETMIACHSGTRTSVRAPISSDLDRGSGPGPSARNDRLREARHRNASGTSMSPLSVMKKMLAASIVALASLMKYARRPWRQ